MFLRATVIATILPIVRVMQPPSTGIHGPAAPALAHNHGPARRVPCVPCYVIRTRIVRRVSAAIQTTRIVQEVAPTRWTATATPRPLPGTLSRGAVARA